MKLFYSAVLGAALCAANAAQAQMPPVPPPSIMVTGEATLKLVPDQATLPVTVYAEDKNLNAAKEANDKKLRAVLVLAKELGVPEHKLKTQYTQVSPQYDYQPNSNKPVFRNYMVSNAIDITLTDLSKLPLLMDGLVKQGIERIGSVQFSLQDEKKVKDDMLATAAQNARAKAEKIVSVLGAKVGKPLMIAEDGSRMVPPPYPVPMARMAMAEAKMADAPPSLPEGQMEIRQQVSVTFALE